MRKALVVLLLVVLAGLAGRYAWTSSTPDQAEADAVIDPSSEAGFVVQINAIRSASGLPPLVVDGELTAIARVWTDQMVASGGISHNPSFSSSVTAAWSALAENVGFGGSVDSLMAAFVNSPSHYANIVNPVYTHIGVGVSYSTDGAMFVTQDFMAVAGVVEPPASTTTTEPMTPAPRTTTTLPPAVPRAVPAAVTVPPPPASPARVGVLLYALRRMTSESG